MKAIVIDIVNNEAALLKEDGTLLKVADQSYQIGQEVTIKPVPVVQPEETPNMERKVLSFPKHLMRKVIAATIPALLLTGGGICAYAMPYGTVTQGESSSIEYTINVFDRVIDVKANDEDGEALLNDAGNLKHKKIDEALDITLAAGTTISVETRNEKHDEKLMEELNRTFVHMHESPEDSVPQKDPQPAHLNKNESEPDKKEPANAVPEQNAEIPGAEEVRHPSDSGKPDSGRSGSAEESAEMKTNPTGANQEDTSEEIPVKPVEEEGSTAPVNPVESVNIGENPDTSDGHDKDMENPVEPGNPGEIPEIENNNREKEPDASEFTNPDKAPNENEPSDNGPALSGKSDISAQNEGPPNMTSAQENFSENPGQQNDMDFGGHDGDAPQSDNGMGPM